MGREEADCHVERQWDVKAFGWSRCLPTFVNLRTDNDGGRHQLGGVSVAQHAVQLVRETPGESGRESYPGNNPCPTRADISSSSNAGHHCKNAKQAMFCRSPGCMSGLQTHVTTMSWCVLSGSPLGLAEVMASGPVMLRRWHVTVRSEIRIMIESLVPT